MSCYFDITKSDLVIKKSEVKNILLDVRKANEKWGIKELENIKSMKTLFDFIGIDYEENEFDETYEVTETDGEVYEVYEFAEIMDIIAKNVDNTKTFTMILNYAEYDTKEKWIINGGKRKVLRQELRFVE